MKKFRTFVVQQSGSAPLWTAFIAIVLISFSLLIYTGMTVQTNYRQAQTELERAANISLDVTLKNPAVRDIQLGVPISSVQTKLAENLLKAGFTRNADGDWQRLKDGKAVYTLKDWQMLQQGEQYQVSGMLKIPLLWGPETAVEIPIRTNVQVIFLDFR